MTKEIKIQKEILYQKYILGKKSTTQIAKELNVGRTTIYRKLKKYNISMRTSAEAQKGKIPWSKNLTKEISDGIRRISESKKGDKNPMKNPKTAKKVGKTKRRLFREGKLKPTSFWKGKPHPTFKKLRNQDWFMKKMIKSLQLKPNKPEQFMINLIKENNLPFKYVGDGKVVIGGKCPDFLSKNPKKIIEVFGEVFHDPSKTFKKSIPYNQTKKGTINHYSKYGFQSLVIWVNELRKPIQVLNKIKNFIE